MALGQFKLIVPTQFVFSGTGTAVQLTSNFTGSKANYLPTSGIFLQADPGNTGTIYIGLSTVSSSLYMVALKAGVGATIDVSQIRGIDGEVDLADFWAVNSASGDVLAVSYEAANKKQE